MKLELYAAVLGRATVYDEKGIVLYQKLRCGFYDEYNEKRDSTPVRELKIHKDKIGEYVIHKSKRYYIN